MKKILLFMAVLFCTSLTSWAQERTVTGTVTSVDDGEPIPGVNVVLKGTSNGTITDGNGKYSIKLTSNEDILSFSFIGMKSQDVSVGTRSIVDIKLTSDTQTLSEVLVTAQGIKRKKEALGFAVSSIDADEVSQKTEGDVVRSLRSKASGVQITQQSGLSGSGTNIVIRGYTSFTGDNQPLFIIDGVPFNTNTNSGGDDGSSGDDFYNGGGGGSSRFMDLDPNNIESINILKGLAASTLYGSQGRNGVVLITTKSGASGQSQKKMDVTLTQSYFANKIASLPDYQDSFGGGFDQVFGWFFSNWGPNFNQNGLAGWGSDASIDENGTLPHPYSQFRNPALLDAFPEFQGARYDFRPYDNVKNFFRTGGVANTSLNIRGASDDGSKSYNINYGFLDDQGFTPGNELNRNTLGLGGRLKLDNGLTVSGTMNLTRTEFLAPPIAASEGNGAFDPITGNDNTQTSSVFGHVFFTPRSIDLINLPFANPVDGSSVYYRNGNDIQHPLWTVNNAYTSQLTNRIFGNTAVSYKIMDNLDVSYRLGFDIYNERNEAGQNKGGVEGPLNGQYRTFDNLSTIWDHTLSLNGNYELNEKASINVNLGATSRRTELDRQGVTSQNQLVFGTFRHFNFSNQSPIQFYSEQNIVGLFAQAELDYNGYLFVTVAGRNDWVSNFTKNNRTLFYPSISTSLILSELMPEITSQKGLNLLKLRAGYGTSAGFRGGYPTASTLEVTARDFVDQGGNVVSTNTTGSLLGNPDLRPERQNELELGFESRLWDNRINFDLSWYSRSTTDLIVARPLDPSTGYTSTFTNIGKVNNVGIEIDMGVDVIRNGSKGFNWNVRGNFTRNRSEVTDLGNEAENISIAGLPDLGNFAVEGEQLGVILGSRIRRTDADAFIVNSQGSYVEEEGLFKIGDPNPDFTLNISNTLSYKNFSLSAVLNYIHGGDIYSRTVSTLLGRGLTTDTEDRVHPFILDGVKNIAPSDAPPEYVTNDIQINNSTFYFSNVLFGPDELGIFDATTIRLQELSLTYTLPKAVLDKLPFGTVSLTAAGYNLWFEAVNIPKGTNFDPNVAGTGVGNGQGFDFLNGPSSKRYGASLKLTF